MALQAAAFVDGRDYAAEDVRRLVYAATNGSTGVAKAGTYVTPTTTPSGQVLINALTGYVVSPFAPNQSYVVSNDQAYAADVPANNTAAAVKYYVAIVVDDPQYAGTAAPTNPKTALYCRLVIATSYPSGSKPCLLLATINMPPNASTVTAAMITQEAVVANPRSYRPPFFVSSPGATYSLGTSYTQWPGTGPTAAVPFEVPTWARRMNVQVVLSGVEIMVDGYARAEIKPTLDGVSDNQPISLTVKGQKGQRVSFTTAASFNISPAQRGNVVKVHLRGAVKAGAAGAFQLDTESNVTYDVVFMEN